VTDRVRITAEDYFAIIPEQVLYARLPDRSVRLYGVLRRHADQDGTAKPGRTELASLLHCSPKSIDRAIEALVAGGFVTKHTRFDPVSKTWETTEYTILTRRADPAGEAPDSATEGGAPVTRPWTPVSTVVSPVTRGGGAPVTGGVVSPVSTLIPEYSQRRDPSLRSGSGGETPVSTSDHDQVPERPTDTDPDDRADVLGELKAVLVELFGEPPPARWALYNRVATHLRDHAATAGEVRRRAGLIVDEWGRKALTVTSLETHWTRYDALVGTVTDAAVDDARAERIRAEQRARFEEVAERRRIGGGT
jgi:hypothetical protein